jgi:hypothetical protein
LGIQSLFILYTKHADTRCGKYYEVTHVQARGLKNGD